MNLAVGLMEGRESVDVDLRGTFRDAGGRTFSPGKHHFTEEVALSPTEAAASFEVDDVTIGIGFHWERKEQQSFRGGLRVLRRKGLTVINDVPLEEYVASVISSEMSGSCPLDLLKAHAVISRSWLCYPKLNPESVGPGNVSIRKGDEITRWYGREAHSDFDVCADDHCQRYQGITKTFSPAVSAAVQATDGEVLWYAGKVCDARFYKCCGGSTDEYRTAWDDREVPYLISFPDTDKDGRVYCDTRDKALLAQILPGFDQETQDFYRWTVTYTGEEIRDLVKARLNDARRLWPPRR